MPNVAIVILWHKLAWKCQPLFHSLLMENTLFKHVKISFLPSTLTGTFNAIIWRQPGIVCKQTVKLCIMIRIERSKPECDSMYKQGILLRIRRANFNVATNLIKIK